MLHYLVEHTDANICEIVRFFDPQDCFLQLAIDRVINDRYRKDHIDYSKFHIGKLLFHSSADSSIMNFFKELHYLQELTGFDVSQEPECVQQLIEWQLWNNFVFMNGLNADQRSTVEQAVVYIKNKIHELEEPPKRSNNPWNLTTYMKKMMFLIPSVFMQHIIANIPQKKGKSNFQPTPKTAPQTMVCS
jgi:hypothetical protein